MNFLILNLCQKLKLVEFIFMPILAGSCIQSLGANTWKNEKQLQFNAKL